MQAQSVEERMSDFSKTLAAISLCSASVFGVPALAQGVQEQQAAPSATTQPDTAPADTAQPDATQADTSKAGPAEEQPATAAPASLGTPVQLGEGSKTQAEHSAQATAHKSVSDPNNQLGTSLQGRTRPVAGETKGPPYDTAAAATAPEKVEQ